MDYRRMADASADTSSNKGSNPYYLCEADLYKELWHGRDFEITSLWQRSIFLGTFLVIAYTGYGALWLALIKENIDIINPTATNYALNIGFLSLAGFGLVMSILWVQMAKGSKRWYERYESSIALIIDNFELENRVFSFPKQPNDQKGIPMHGYLEDTDYDYELLSTKSGGFSVSRINIALGQVAFIIWRLLLGLHFLLTVLQLCIGVGWSDYIRSQIFGGTVGVVIGLGIAFWVICPLIKICCEQTCSGVKES